MLILPVHFNLFILCEKGFYAFAFLLSIFGAIAVQKNTRDAQAAGKDIEPVKEEK